MSILSNAAFWIATSAVGLYWLAVWALGADLARDAVDWASIFMGVILAGHLLPDAYDRFTRGASRSGWQLLLGNVLWLLGWVCFCAWTYSTRALDRPEWMVLSPLNGFFKFWILGGIVLSYFATTGELHTFRNPGRLYYVVVGLIAGILIGVAAARFFALAGG